MADQVTPSESADLAGHLGDLAELGIRAVRLQYADLHGICRGKDIPSSHFAHAAEEGIGFVEAIMTVDLRHNVVAGFERGFPDITARPDLSTLARLPGRPRSPRASSTSRTRRAASRPRWTRAACSSACWPNTRSWDCTPVVGPELEFYLCEPDTVGPPRLLALRGAGEPGLHGRATSPTPGARCRGCSTPRSSSDWARSPRRTSTAAASSRSTSATRAALDSADRAFRFKRSGQGDGGARLPAGHVHGQAVQRRRGVGLSPAHLALRRRRFQPQRGRIAIRRAWPTPRATSSPA